MSCNDITSEGVKFLLGFPKQSINKLKVLDLSQNKLGSESCAVLACLIPHVPHLKKLDLSYSPNIGQRGAVPLITSLTGRNSLEELSLYDTGIGVEDCRALSELLSSSTSLRELNISSNHLPPEAVELIISGLQHNTTLKWLDMNGSHFSLQNTISLASVLRTKRLVNCTDVTLQWLNPWYNPWYNPFEVEGAEMLRINHTFVYLNLGSCNIVSDGALQLASALCINNTLQTLSLWGNPIGPEGATAFAEMLLKNKSLKELILKDDSIGEEGTQKLIDSLTHNTTVKLYLPKKYRKKYKSITSSDTDRRVRFI